MKKGGIILSLSVALVLLASPVSQAVDVNFLVTAEVPQATGVSIVATSINAATEEFGAQVTELDFGTLVFDSTFGIFRSTVFYVVDVGATGGAGSPNVTVTFSNEINPANQTTGLGSKATIAFTKVTGGPAPSDQTETEMVAHGPVKLLKQIAGGEQINSSELIGGFMRSRIGIYDGSSGALNAAGGEPFTPGDMPGSYKATVTYSGTLT